MASNPNGRRKVLAACTIGNMVSTTPAVHAVFGLFLVPLSQAFGWSRASISASLAIVALGGVIVYPLAGRYADRHGARRMVIVGNIAFAAAIATLAATDGNILHFYLSFAFVAVAGAVPATAVFAKVISDWFDDNRGTMMGVAAGIGQGVGATLLPIVAAVLLARFGWRGAYLGVAGIVLMLGCPALVFLLRDAPRYDADDGAAPATAAPGVVLHDALRTSAFWLILAAFASGAGCMTAIFSHVVPILGERGIGTATSTAVVGVFAIVGSSWQIALGRLLDRIETPRIVVPSYILGVAGLALLELGHATGPLLAAGALLGLGLGSQYGALGFFVARYFGLRDFGTIIGTMYAAVIATQGTMPILLDAAFDEQGTYRLALAGAGGALVLGAGLILLLPPYRMAPAGREALPLAAA